MSLALIEDDDVLDLTNKIDTFESDQKDDQGQARGSRRERLEDDKPLYIHPGIVPVPAPNDDHAHHLRPDYDREEEENLLDKHVGEIVWPDFVFDSIAIGIADTVATLTVRALLEHVANNLLSDANPVILQVAITWLYVLLAVLRLSTSNA